MPPTIDHFLIFDSEYDDPVSLVGPYPSYRRALDGYYQRCIDSGSIEEGETTPEDHYATDDAVRIGRVDQVPCPLRWRDPDRGAQRRRRVYFSFDVTDLTPEEADRLVMHVMVQAEGSDDPESFYPGVSAPEVQWDPALPQDPHGGDVARTRAHERYEEEDAAIPVEDSTPERPIWRRSFASLDESRAEFRRASESPFVLLGDAHMTFDPEPGPMPEPGPDEEQDECPSHDCYDYAIPNGPRSQCGRCGRLLQT